MFRKLILLCTLVLTSCISITVETDTPTQAVFATSTLPSTPENNIPSTRTPTLAIMLTPTIAVTIPPNCTDSAVLLEDVTIPDNTRVNPSQKFTKTWRFLNNGTCPWLDYTLKFAAGDQMGAPLSAPIPFTNAKDEVEISVELTAPATDGSYTAYFALNNPNGKDVPIGAEKTFWVKIVVGSGTAVPTTSGSVPTQSGTTGTGGGETGNCNYSQNSGFVGQIESLINSERVSAGLPALAINSALSSAAAVHVRDMACSNMLSHTGSDGSSVHTRIVAAGYVPSFSEEIIYAGGGPQTAMTWWMNDQIHRDAILNANVTEMGIGHANSANGSYGDYYTVDFASP
ncbi:MAG: NBR1-Ig-like domain-containing protein [Chloroflexota bacterium]